MTVLHLDIILHYYTSPEDYPEVHTNDTRKSFDEGLFGCGILERITEKGGFDSHSLAEGRREGS